VAPGATILDFGCGTGLALRELRRQGFDAYGFDVQVKKEPHTDAADLIEAGIVRVSTDAAQPLPFPDGMFDVIFSYQVMEHVQDYTHSVAELARVMKPGGVSLHVFPSRYRPIEAHVGVPFSSMIQKMWWLRLWLSLGFRLPHQRNLPRSEILTWNHFFLTTRTRYLPGREIRRHFAAHFQEVAFVEREFLLRFGRIRFLPALIRVLPFLPRLFGTFWTRVLLAGNPILQQSQAPKRG
jgi:SAM-dependent methyltransferase